MRRLGLLGFALVTLVGSIASAQTPPPPTGYAAAVSPDTMLEPMLTAAEADLGRGDPAMALARAQIVVAAVPSDGPSRIRAEGLVLLAQQRLAGATAEVSADVVYAPLVDAAAADGPAGRVDLARARIDFVLGRVVATSPLASRATAIRAALDAHTTSATTTYQPAYGSGAPTYVYTPVTSQQILTPERPPADPSDPRRRGDSEIAELYVTAGIFGAFTGAWIPYGAGLFDTASEEDRARGTTIAVFLGAGVLALGVFGIDQIDHGLRTGVPAGISMGIRYGFALAALSLGVHTARNGVSPDEAFNVMGFSALGGGLLGALLTMTLEPHPSQVQFTQISGLWGAIWGANIAMIAAPLMSCELGSCANRQEVGFGLVAGGLSAGILTGMLISALHANTSARRAGHMTLGLLAGVGGGTALWALISAASDTLDVPTLGGCMLVGSVTGLVIAGFLSGGDRERRTWDDEPEAAEPTYQVTFAPSQGGGTIGVAGTF